MRHYEEAFAAYTTALELDPSQLPVYETKARLAIRLKRYEQVLDLCEQALPLADDVPTIAADLLAYQSRALLSLHRYPESLGAAERALALDPTHLRAQSSKATALFYLRRYRQALRTMWRAGKKSRAENTSS